ncbi:MAG: TonB-dependent receptor [Acidobacteriota bacterium]|nr:TonB-dependent receptor [Acidobacteriota bacterium]
MKHSESSKFLWERLARNCRLLFPCFLLPVLLAVSTWAETPAATVLKGSVVDSSQAVVAGAKITVVNAAGKVAGTAVTRADGGFAVTGIAAGSYRVQATARGFELATVHVELTAETAPVKLTLKIASHRESLDVLAAKPLIGEAPDAPGKKDYVVTSSTTGSKAELPDSWVAQDVVIVPAKVLDDQNITSAVGAEVNVAGVTNTYPSYYPLDAQGSTYIRGFAVSQTLRNGLWDSQSNGNIGWLGSVDQIEVLKGAAGLEYGTYWGGIGGVLNLITKKPLTVPRYSFQVNTDSYGSWGLGADLSQPLTRNKKWLARVNLNIGDTVLFARNFDYTKRDASIIVQGALSSKDAVTFEYERRWQTGNPYSGLPGYGLVSSTGALKSFGNLSTWINLYSPSSHWTYNAHDVHAAYEHRFNQNWRVHWGGSLTRTGRETPQILATPSYNSTGTIITYNESFGDIHMGPELTWDSDAMLEGHFNLGNVKNVMTAGYRFSKGGYHMNMFSSALSGTKSFTDPENPVWATHGTPARYVWGLYWERQQDLYVSDVAALTSKLRITAGINYTPAWKSADEFGMSVTKAQNSLSTETDSGKSWRVGAMYDLLPSTTMFADYATTFYPNSSNTTNTGVIQNFDPLTGAQYELGVKSAITKRFNLTAAIYKLQLNNMIVSDPDPTLATEGFEVSAGHTHSRGFELDGKYRLGKGWDLLTAYAFTDVREGNNASYVVGSTVPNVSKETLRIFATHEFTGGTLKGLEAGAGVTAASRFTSNLVPSTTPTRYVTLPAYGTVDAMLGYKFAKHYRVIANVTNLFDHRYTTSASSYGWFFPGAPVTATFRVQSTF